MTTLFLQFLIFSKSIYSKEWKKKIETVTVRYKIRLHCTCDRLKNHICVMVFIYQFFIGLNAKEKNEHEHNFRLNWNQRQQQKRNAIQTHLIPLHWPKWINVQCWHKEWHRVINHNYLVILFVQNHWTGWSSSSSHMKCVCVCACYTFGSNNKPFKWSGKSVFMWSLNNELLNIYISTILCGLRECCT